TLTGMTIRHGQVQPALGVYEGGGIYNAGWLTLNSTVITANVAYADGGGIYNFGTLTVTNSTIANNIGTSGSSTGGGIFNTGGLATLNDSIVSGNTSTFSGGIWNEGTMVLNNVTVNANGGGVDNGGTLTLNNSTVSSNATRGITNYTFRTLTVNNST